MNLERFIKKCQGVFGNEFFSDEFIEILHKKLPPAIISLTQLEVETASRICKVGFDQYSFNYSLKSGIGCLEAYLLVYNTSFPFSICWKTNNKFRIIYTNSIGLDEGMEVWIQGIDLERLSAVVNETPPKINIDSAQLNYNLITDFYHNEACFLDIKYGSETAHSEIENKLDALILEWNEEPNNQKKGVFHNSMIHKSFEGNLIYNLDLGSAASSGLIALLKTLSDIKGIESVSVTSYV